MVAAGHIVSVVRKQREADTLFAFSFLLSGMPAYGMELPAFREGLRFS